MVKGAGKQKLTPLATAERAICDGSVVLFRRSGSKRWQARIRRTTGRWVVYSTKEADIEAAKAVAEDRYRDMKYAQQMGRIDVTRRFNSVCQQCRKELLEENARTGRVLPKDMTQVIDKYIVPILGSYMCHNIGQTELQKYSTERSEILGRNPSSVPLLF